MNNLIFIKFVAIFLICSFSYVYSEEVNITPYKKHAIYCVWENDLISLIHTDRNYTNGLRCGYHSKEYDYYSENNEMAWAKNVSILNYNKPHITRFYINLNQEMYTPQSLEKNIPANEHAYGGFLYLNTGIFNRTKNTLEHIGIKLGVVGKYSFAKEAQEFVHRVTGKEVFEGWDKQLASEFIFNPFYQWTGRVYLFKRKTISMDFLGTFDIALGNADTHFGGYATFRIGHNLDNDFGIQKINVMQDMATVHSDKFSAYFFIGGGPRVVLYNLFVAGNSKESDLGHNINLIRFDATAGATISYYGVRAGYAFTFYTKEYTTQPYGHTYGTLFLEISF